MYKCKWFKVSELLPKELFKSENQGWNIFDDRLKETLDAVREILQVPLICNNWMHGGNRNNCGARTKNSPYYRHGSYHTVRPDRKVMAADLVSSRMSAQEMRDILVQNYKRLPYPVRIEQGVTWLHIDVAEVPGYKIYFFKP